MSTIKTEPGGYAGKWLDIDLTKGKIETVTFPYEYA